MKALSLLLTVIALAGTFASAAPIQAKFKPVRVHGALATMIFDLAGKYANADGGLGHVYANTEQVTCIKHVDEKVDTGNEIKCTFQYQGTAKTISTNNDAEYEDAMNMRKALIEALGPDKKVSAVEKQISVKQIDCEGISSGNEFDTLDMETGVSCDLKK
jgi:hypothetical protein